MPHKDPAARRAYESAYYKAHPEKQRRKIARWRTKNPEKHRAYTRTSYQKHREKRLQHDRAYRLANPDKVLATQQAYNTRHPERRKMSYAKYQREHPERTRMKCAARRARIAGAPINDFTLAQWIEMKEHYGYCCVYCGQKTIALTQDHITPLSKGGSHTLSNIVPACNMCNMRKHNNDPLVPVQPLLLTVAPKKHNP